MGRKVWKPDYDKVAEWLYEGMPPEIRIKFIQKFLSLDSSLGEAILKLSRAKEQQKEKKKTRKGEKRDGKESFET